ncbi:MAG: sugar transferase [Bacteroides sp.]|nr:sugar transferase [Bacillota bacterium]MCM1393749.1 sugar transferase [[Eubacterium] siraeum]MCM1454950.1 sugar transferase [Bacteroides sp.]
MYKVFKAVMDRLLAFLGLIVLFLPLVIVAIAIRIDSKGPAIFKQERVGKGGKPFMCYKFRTMFSTDIATPAYNPIVTDDNENLTKVGRRIRKLKIDEFLQLINVLKGEMSLIGPRPFMAIHTENFEPWEYQKFAVKPGMSGLSQIKGNVYLSGVERSYYDVIYAQKPSLFMDIEILFKTVGVIFVGEEKFLSPVPADKINELRREFNDRQK